MPQETLGLNASDSRDLDFVRETYIHFDEDMRDSMRFLNPESLSLLPANLQEPLKMLEIEYDVDKRHNEISYHILRSIRLKSFTEIQEAVLRATHLRGFPGQDVSPILQIGLLDTLSNLCQNCLD